MDYGKEKNVFYFKEEGKINTPKVIDLTLKKAGELDINKILVFTSDGETAFNLREKDKDIDIIAVSFPANQEIRLPDSKNRDDFKYIIPKTSNEEIKKKLAEKNINLVLSKMPFGDIIIPGTRDTKNLAIRSSLSLISKGLSLCVQAILMATDSGAINPGEEVIAISADTGIVATASNSSFLFHPNKGLSIIELFCKPKSRI